MHFSKNTLQKMYRAREADRRIWNHSRCGGQKRSTDALSLNICKLNQCLTTLLDLLITDLGRP